MTSSARAGTAARPSRTKPQAKSPGNGEGRELCFIGARISTPVVKRAPAYCTEQPAKTPSPSLGIALKRVQPRGERGKFRGGGRASRSRMKPVIQALQPLLVDVGVDLRGG